MSSHGHVHVEVVGLFGDLPDSMAVGKLPGRDDPHLDTSQLHVERRGTREVEPIGEVGLGDDSFCLVRVGGALARIGPDRRSAESLDPVSTFHCCSGVSASRTASSHEFTLHAIQPFS